MPHCITRRVRPLFAGVAMAAIVGSAAIAQDARWDEIEERRYAECMDLVETDPDRGYEYGLAWRFEGGGAPARHCVAAGLVALGEFEEGAARLEDAALAADGGSAEIRAEMLLQASDAWLAANAPAEAERTLTQGLRVLPGNAELLIARGLARGLLADYDAAARDLSIALAERPDDQLALRLRAEALMQLGQLDEAERDVNRAVELAQASGGANPDNEALIEALVVRGRLNETRRTGVTPDTVR